MNPVIAGLLARSPWPAPNQAPDDSGNNLQATTPFANDVDSLIAKIDQHFGESDLLTVRYFYGTATRASRSRSVGGGVLPGFNTVTPTTVHLLSASLTHVVSPKLLFELRGGYNRFDEDFFPEDQRLRPAARSASTTVERPAGLRAAADRGRRLRDARREQLSLPRGRVDTNWQGFANVSYTAGRHTHEGRLRVPAHDRGRVLQRRLPRAC